MLARRKKLEHPLGSAIDMPRLVPAFSSKGFPFYKDKETGQKLSVTNEALKMTGPTISDSILVSAYDLYYGHLKNPTSYFGNKELVMIDSGGYELFRQFDQTEPKYEPYAPNYSYNLDCYKEVLSKLPTGCPIAITNLDYKMQGKGIKEQILEAQALFNDFPNYLHDFIIKPVGKAIYVDIDEIIRHIEKMRRFHIIGITENELGSSILERLTNIAQLRIALNRKSIESPIHVWGGLDPVVSPLYFCAGAEIFDGLSWLRYGYYNDASLPRDAYAAIELGIHIPWRRVQAMRLAKNISCLENLTIRMRRFVDEEHNFKVFESISDPVQQAYQALCTKIPELKGGS